MKSSTYLYAKISRALYPAGVLLLAGIFSGTVAWGQARNIQPEYTGAAANQKIKGADYVQIGKNTTYASFVRMDASSTVPSNQFVPWIKKSMNVPAGTDFQLTKQETDKLGLTHDRYVQTYMSVPIDRAEYVVNSKDGKVAWVNGTPMTAPAGLNPKATLTEAQALVAAMKAIGAKQYKWQSDYWTKDLRSRTKNPLASYLPKGLLCWNVSDDNKTLVLAYRFDIESADPDKVQRIYVNANTGAALKTVPMESNCNSATVNTVFDGNRTMFTQKYTATNFRLYDDCRGTGGGNAEFWIRDWGSATLASAPTEIENTTNTWTTNQERFGGSVLWLVERCFAYWNAAPRSRNSYDNAGGDIDGYINAKFDCSPPAGCVSDFNASMSFGGGHLKVGKGSGFADGYATVDIIGHEFTHAVTGATSGLVYDAESGALNESFSDIFGEATENFVFGSNDWLLGAQRSSGEIRDMSNPKRLGQPDTYLGTNWYTGTADNHGVHTNSGVQNFWFYLLVNGGSGTNDNSQAYNISGVGLATASQVAYLNQISLPSGATHTNARNGAIAAAITISGSACSNLVKQVTNAWYAVGVGTRFFDATIAVTSNYNGRDVSCNGVCDGSAAVTVISGVAPTYSWSPSGGTNASASNLCPGNYTVTITNHDAAACVITRSVTIQNTPLLVSAPAATSNYNGFGVSCFGAHDGSAAANASGGTTPYTYNWNTIPAQHGATATGLGAGIYTVTVIDANGCSVVHNVTITEPPQLTTTAAPITNYNGYNVRCNGGSDGAAETYPVGGVPPYAYSWNTVPVQTTKIATGLSAQNYIVNVTDLNGCGATANTTLTEPPPLTIDAGANKTVYYGYPDSSCATLTATGIGGGVPPLTIMWSTGATTNSIKVCPITSTVYYVTVSDKNGCSVTDSVRVCVIDVRCGNKLDKVTICHNTGDPANPTETLCVALTGAKTHLAQHGCQLGTCGINKVCTFGGGGFARISAAAGIQGDVELTAYPNPFSDYTNIRYMVPADQTIRVGLYDISGREVRSLYNGPAKANVVYEYRLDGSTLPAGMYFLNMKLDNGESYSGKLVITQ